jgi:hypothetical protein
MKTKKMNIKEYFDNNIEMDAMVFYLEMEGDRNWMALHPADIMDPESWTIEDAKLYDLATTMDSMAETIKKGHPEDIKMDDPFTIMILKNIKDWIDRDGNLYKGKSWYGENDYECFKGDDKYE